MVSPTPTVVCYDTDVSKGKYGDQSPNTDLLARDLLGITELDQMGHTQLHSHLLLTIACGYDLYVKPNLCLNKVSRFDVEVVSLADGVVILLNFDV